MFHSSHDDEADRFIWLLQRACSEQEQRYRPLLLSAAAMERDHISLPMYLPASFVTAVANAATPRNTVLASTRTQAQVSQIS
jgi:hypothetical protein